MPVPRGSSRELGRGSSFLNNMLGLQCDGLIEDYVPENFNFKKYHFSYEKDIIII
jgi:hypothetical protein